VNGCELRSRGQTIGAESSRGTFLQLLDSGDSNLKEFIEVARRDAKKAKALKYRHRGVERLREHALVEFQRRKLAIDEGRRRGGRHGRCVVHGH